MEEGEAEEELAPLVRLGLALVEALLGDHLRPGALEVGLEALGRLEGHLDRALQEG